MTQFLTFKRFHTAEQAAEVISLLQEQKIPVEYEEEVILMDKIYVGQNFDQRHLVKIQADDFSRADALLKSLVSVDPDDVEPDYYLLSFTAEELKEVVAQKDEWGDYDYALAIKLLEKQGISYSTEQLQQLGISRLETLSQPQDLPTIWLVIGYLSPLTLLAVFLRVGSILCILGIFIGGFVILTKKTLPNGTRRFAFTENTRAHGKWMIVSSVVLIPLCIYIAIKMM